MASIPSNLARVPNLLSSQITLSNLSRTQVDLLRIQTQLSSGSRIDAPSDDPIGASLVSVLDQRLGRSEQRTRNLEHASSALGTLDQTLAELTNIAQEAKTIASSQVGVGSDAATRASQATVVESLITELVRLGNTTFDGLHLLGGDRTGAEPLQSFFGGYRYAGVGSGLSTDITPGVNAPISIAGDQALGLLSPRIEGDVDLNPALTANTRLSDLRNGEGVALGKVEIEIVNGPTSTLTVDLDGAERIGDVVNAIESAIRQADPGALNGAWPNGVTIAPGGQRLALDVAIGASIEIRDIGGGAAASDLGLSGVTYTNVTPENLAADLDPRLTGATTFAQLGPANPIDYGDIVFRNGSRTGSVTVTPATTVSEFINAVEGLNIGARVEISSDGRSLDAINEVSGFRLSIEEAGGGTLTATTLGLRSFKASTAIGVFNDGRGVEIAHGAVDPVTGLPDPDRNIDLEIELTDGSTFQVDFEPSDMVNVQSVLDRINADAAAAGLGGVFNATLSDGANGIVLEDTAGGGGVIAVRQLNGRAGEDLGLLDGAFAAGAPATFAGEDRATMRVDGLLSALIDLRDALLNDDVSGITFAGEGIESSISRLAQSRAGVGGRAQRVEAAKTREEDSRVLDELIRSRVKDLDFIEASSRFSLLQLTMQAGLASAAQSQSLTLLNFLR